MEENKEVFVPQPVSDALFDDKITPKQNCTAQETQTAEENLI